LNEASMLTNPVMFPPGLAKLATNPLPRGSDTCAKTIGTVLVSDCNAAVAGVVMLTRTSGFSPTNSLANSCTRPDVESARIVDTDVATVDPSQVSEPLSKRGVLGLRFGVSFG